MGIMYTIEFYFNAFCGIMASVGAVCFILLALRSWRAKDSVTGAMFFAVASLCIMIGTCGLVTAITLIAYM